MYDKDAHKNDKEGDKSGAANTSTLSNLDLDVIERTYSDYGVRQEPKLSLKTSGKKISEGLAAFTNLSGTAVDAAQSSRQLPTSIDLTRNRGDIRVAANTNLATGLHNLHPLNSGVSVDHELESF